MGKSIGKSIEYRIPDTFWDLYRKKYSLYFLRGVSRIVSRYILVVSSNTLVKALLPLKKGKSLPK